MKRKVTNWTNYPIVEAEVRNVNFDSEIEQLVNEEEAIIVRGNGRCYGDASLSDTIISTLDYKNILSFDADQGVIVCESGILLSDMLDFLVPKGWFLPVTPGTKFITLGGAVASDVHGKNHHFDGSISEHIDYLEVQTDQGVLRCSNKENEELFVYTCGGMGLTGVILRVALRLKKIETSKIKFKSIKIENLKEAFEKFEQYQHYTYCMAWIDCYRSSEKTRGRSIIMMGEHALESEIPKTKDPLALPNKKKLNIPFFFPGFVLNKLSIKIFNFLYYHKQRKKEVDAFVDYDSFFYPLDSIYNWNRMYGKKGFVQYQFVLPLESSYEGLEKILEKINARGFGSFLAVLKLFGKQDSPVSFPMEGYTLALDFAIKKGLFEFLEELDEIVIALGGRLYLTKDARMSLSTYKATYKNAEEIKSIISKYNSKGKFSSFLSKRLNII